MGDQQIHPMAVIGEGVQLGQGVRIGPYALIGDYASIADNCEIAGLAVIHSRVQLGPDNRVFAHAVLGGDPQDLGFDRALPTRLEIGRGNQFREGVTVNRGSAASGLTRIGDHCFFMNNSHVGHDCRVGDRVIAASGVALGGHVEVDAGVFFGGGAMVHQFCRIGAGAMVAGMAAVRQDVIPFAMVAGDPAKHYRLNVVGLRRSGIEREPLRALSRALRQFRECGDRQFDDLMSSAALDSLRRWLQAPSKRGISGFVRTGSRSA